MTYTIEKLNSWNCPKCNVANNGDETDCFACRAEGALKAIPAEKFAKLFSNDGELQATITMNFGEGPNGPFGGERYTNIQGVNHKAGYRDNGFVLAIPDVSDQVKTINIPTIPEPALVVPLKKNSFDILDYVLMALMILPFLAIVSIVTSSL